MKRLPQRTCIGCLIKKDKNELIRIVKNQKGEIAIDKTGKLSGRGAYLCDNTECLEMAIKSRRLEKSFETKIETDIYEELKEEIKE